MSAAVEAAGLGKQYGSFWALQGCHLQIPEGRVVALVGPNGAGVAHEEIAVFGFVRRVVKFREVTDENTFELRDVVAVQALVFVQLGEDAVGIGKRAQGGVGESAGLAEDVFVAGAFV